MAKEIGVNLKFNANTTDAKNKIQELQKALTEISQISSKSASGMALQKDLNNASMAAAQLQVILKDTVNTDTGKLNLTKFTTSLKQSGLTLDGLKSSLTACGTLGNKAFMQLAQSITTAEAPIISVSAKLRSLGTTLANTAKWQLSSSLLHGFISSVSEAYHYVQDLNESLNNIRIVTGASIEKMDAFAAKANKAAQALSTTTTAYTDAALIYYQQGLSDEEVEARTEVTIKMANAVGKSAQEISQQLTAVWNNFADGSENLEHYADVMTALGAATASSTDEIAQGLNKFSAVANTVGLSYEYAAAALATVTATTRQSADVVGTAFKTLFARIQDLELGKTLDDGTSLGKYSQALKTIGIDIKDSSGQMKDMNAILDEMGSKWSALSKDTQVAVAQAVGGTRQYTQLIALMDNWDFMKSNLNIANTSDGTLEKQAEIYAESWDGAKAHVKAAAEDIYSSILDDDFFIKMTDSFAKFLSTIKLIIDGLGGIKGVLLTVATIVTTLYQSKISTMLNGLGTSLSMLTAKGRASIEAQRNQANQNLGDMYTKTNPGDSGAMQAQAATALGNANSDFAEKTKNMTEQQKQIATIMLQQREALTQEAIAQGNVAKEAEKTAQSAERALKATESKIQYDGNRRAYSKDSSKQEQDVINEAMNNAGVQPRKQEFKTSTDKVKTRDILQASFLENTRLAAQGDQVASALTTDKINSEAIGKNKENVTNLDASLEGNSKIIDDLSTKMGSFKQIAAEAKKDLKGMFGEDIGGALEHYSQTLDAAGEAQTKLQASSKKLKQAISAEDSIRQKAIKALKANGKEIDENANSETVLTACQEKDLAVKEELNAAQDKTKNAMNEVTQSATEYETKLNEVQDASNKLDGSISDLSQKATMQREALEHAFGVDPSKLEEAAQAERELGMSTGDQVLKTGEAITANKTYGQTLDELKNKNMDLGSAVTTYASTLGQVAMGINAIQNLGNIWNDEDATLGQKIISTLTTMSMLLPIIITLTNQEKLVNLGAASAKMLSGIKSLFKAKSTVAETAATKAQTAANVGLLASMQPVLLVTLLLTAAIFTLIAVFKGISVLIEKISDAYNADAIAAENAENAAKNLAEAYKETKQAYEDLKTSISDYQDAKTALDELTKGTAEWRDQLREANEQAMELINAYPKLKEYAEYNKNGLLEISQEGLDILQEQQSKEVDSAYARSLMADVSAKQARQKSDMTDFQRENHKSFWEGAGDIATATSIGAIAGPIGVIGGLAAGIAGIVTSNQSSDAKIQAAIDNYVANNGQFDAKNDAELADTLNVSVDLIPAIRELGDSAIAAGDAMKAAAEESTRAILESNEIVQDSIYGDDVSAFADDIYQAAFKDVYDRELIKAKDRGKFNTGTNYSKEAMETYAAEMHLNDLKNYKVTNYKGDGTVEYEYIDDDGKTQKKTVTAEEIATVNASKIAKEVATTGGEEIAKILNKVDATTEKQLLALEKGDVSNLSLSELNKNMNLNNLSAKEIAILNIDGIGAKQDSEGVEDYKKRIQKALDEKVDEAKKKIVEDTGTKYSAEVKNIVEGIVNDANGAFSKVSQGTISTYSDALGQISQNAGSTVAKEFNTAMKGVLADHAEEEEEILSAAAGIDWTKGADAVNEFYSNLTAMGIKIDQANDDWERMVAAIQRINVSVLNHDIDALREKVKNIADLTKDIKIGSVISDEDYNKLVGYNSKLADMFALTAEGYQYIGTQDLSTIAGDMAKSAYEDALQQNEDARNAYSQFYDQWGWTEENGEKVSVADRAGQYANGTRSAAEMANTFNAMAKDKDASAAISALGYDKGELQNYANMISEGAEGEHGYTKEQIEAATAELQQYYADIATLQTQIENGDFSDEKAGELYATSMLNAASSIEELNNAWAEVNETLGETDYSLYASALIGLGSEYDNCAEEIDKYREALNSADEAQLKQAEDMLQSSIMAGEAAEKYGLDAETLEIQAQQIAKEYGITASAAANLAIRNERMNKGVVALNKDFASWNKTLTTADHKSQDYADALKQANKALADLTGALDEASIPADFLNDSTKEGAEHLKLLGKAAEGDVKAINMLGAELAQSQLSKLEAILPEDAFDADGQIIDRVAQAYKTKFDEAKQIVNDGIDAIKSKLGELKDGDSLTDVLGEDGVTNWANALNTMAYDTNMSVDEMKSYLNELGIEADVTTTEKTLETKKPVYRTRTRDLNSYTDEYGTWTDQETVTWVDRYETIPETVQVAQINMGDKKGTPPTMTYRGAGSSGGVSPNSKSSGGGGGGGGGNKKKTSDEKDRYHEVTKKLDDLGRAYDRLSKHKEHAFGKSYINTIREETKALDEQINTLNSKLKEAEGYYKEDLAAIEKYGAIVDENGNITNYNAIIEKYVNLFNSGSIDEDAYSEMKDALDRFEDTADTLEDIKDEIKDKVYEKVTLEIERIDTEVNMNIEINDEDLQQLEYLLAKIENQSFNTAKQIAIMGYQTDEVFSKINTYEAGLKSLEEQAAQNLANGLFTEAGGWDSSMKDKAKEFTDGLMEANKTLLEYKQTLTEKFQEAIDEVNETFDNQIGRFDNYTSILESYTEILHLTGKTLKNSDLIIKFGNQQVEVARNQLVALKAQQNTLYASLAEAQQKLADAQARGDQDAIRHWTDEVNNITIQAEEGKANLISSFQEAMNTAADVFASTVEQFSAQAEAALSIYDTLEEAQDAYDRAKERSEWFLDNATQAYELSKLMRNINQQIDKTNNLGAQVKLRDILDEINDIQKNNVKISQDDLDILNAKYELRLAEIALEEAQNAKDTVKLSRNAEGGWGYVYTANQDTTDKAIQDYEDKAYNLEKLIKEKITNISDAILENKQDTLDRIASLNIKSFENEQEYWDAVNKIREEGLAKDLYLRNGLERMLTEGNLSYADIILKDFENADSLEEGRLIFEQITQDLLDNASNAYAELIKQTNGLLEALGFESAEDLLTWLQSSADDIVNGANGLSSKLIQYSEESQKAIKEAADAIADYEKKYNDSIKSMMDMSEAMIKTVTEMLRRFGLLDNNATLADFWNGDIVEDHSTPAQYDTGGYTGEWGQAGKLAVLHEKELVLNKNETEDLLKIMDIMKDRVLQDKLNGMEKYLNTAQQVIDNLFKNGTNNELEQNVHITAEFPNVTDHNEIEEAFNNLINSASQYINRY